MKLPSDAPKLPKWIFLIGDAALVVTAWFLFRESPHPLTGMTLLAVASCVIAGVVVGAFPFIADYSRRQEETLDDRQRSLHSLSVTVAASSEQIAIAATGLQGLSEAAQGNLEKSERISTQIQEKMTELQALLAAAKKDDGEAAARLEAVAKKITSAVASFEAAAAKVAKAAEAALAAPQVPTPAPEVAPVPPSRIVRIKPAAAPSLSPFDGPPAEAKPTAEAPQAPAVVPEARPAAEATAAPETAPAAPASPPPAESAAVPDAMTAEATAVAPAPAPRKRSPRKPAPPPVAPAPDLVLESPAPPDAELPLAVPEVAEPAVSSDGATRLIVTAYIGIGNRLFIRGEGPGLTWEKGVPLSFVSIGKWRWESSDATKAVKFKLYKNDEAECTSLGERLIEPGAQQELTASF